MSTRIYQAYYRDDQLAHLNPEFTPYDNRHNPVANLYERYIYQQTAAISRSDGIELWGTFSWQWKKKLPGPSAQDILNFIANNPGQDVYIFNVFPFNESISYNVWEQGQWCCPYMIHLGKKLLELMGEDPELVEKPMTRETYLTANYFVGTDAFWTGLLEFLDRFASAIPRLSAEDTQLLLSSAGYEPNPTLDHSGFICERLISTYFIKHPELRIKSWAGPEYLSDLKMAAVTSHNQNAILQWDSMRPATGPKIATSWIKKQF
jgi:hypothetical protein